LAVVARRDCSYVTPESFAAAALSSCFDMMFMEGFDGQLNAWLFQVSSSVV
jgi:hypothetical protein